MGGSAGINWHGQAMKSDLVQDGGAAQALSNREMLDIPGVRFPATLSATADLAHSMALRWSWWSFQSFLRTRSAGPLIPEDAVVYCTAKASEWNPADHPRGGHAVSQALIPSSAPLWPSFAELQRAAR